MKNAPMAPISNELPKSPFTEPTRAATVSAEIIYKTDYWRILYQIGITSAMKFYGSGISFFPISCLISSSALFEPGSVIG